LAFSLRICNRRIAFGGDIGVAEHADGIYDDMIKVFLANRKNDLMHLASSYADARKQALKAEPPSLTAPVDDSLVNEIQNTVR
jgi:hypothetical protein